VPSVLSTLEITRNKQDLKSPTHPLTPTNFGYKQGQSLSAFMVEGLFLLMPSQSIATTIKIVVNSQ